MLKTNAVHAEPETERSRETENSLHRRLNRLLELNREQTEIVMEIKRLLSGLDIPDSTHPGEEYRPRTGYRFVRGTHSGTYIRDPQGTDPLPFGYTIPEA